MKSIVHLISRLKLGCRLALRKWWRGPGIFSERYLLEDNSHVTLYTDDDHLLLAFSPRERLHPHLSKRKTRVSLIASAKDEAAFAEQWCESILGQSRVPDEIVIVDAGSQDGTVDKLRAFAAQSAIPFRVMVEPGCNIARARNIAITHAQYPIIAVTDFGCLPQIDWLEKLIAPFEANAEMRVVAGLYAPVDRRQRPLWREYSIYPNLRRIHPQNFIPSNRSIAFAKETWQAVGGYPAWLTLTGEDTWFDRELKRNGGEWAFVPEAVVKWYAPENFGEYGRKVFKWTKGDGESGLHASYYWRYVLQLTAAIGGAFVLIVCAALVAGLQIAPVGIWLTIIAVLCLAGMLIASHVAGVALPILFPEALLECVHIAGFVVGARGRNAALKRRLASVHGLFFVLSGVPIDDTGGGARCTQITLELLRQGFAVVFIHKFPKYESKELALRIGHPNLFIYALSDFRWDEFRRAEGQSLNDKPLAALVEFPLRDFLQLIREVRAHRGIVVYDSLDAWDTPLGGNWYAPEIEREIVDSSQVLVATVPSLADRLSQMTGRTATLLPNAVNARLFDSRLRYARPPDFLLADWTMVYTGALWGDWFDWELLKQIGKAYPQAAVLVIGDYRGQCADAPANVHFLGLKAQKHLPAYLAHSNVAIIPWRANKITEATSPLKVYEYLAMCLPVVAPELKPLQDMPAVYLAQDAKEFVSLVERASKLNFPTTAVELFLRENNWETRVRSLLALIEQTSFNQAESKPLTGTSR